MKKSELSALKNEIVRLADEGRRIRGVIRTTRALKRYQAWNEKREVGWIARDCLLAYAFARGVPYRVVEPPARRPDPYDAFTAKLLRKSRALAVSRKLSEMGYAGSAEEIDAWLEVPEDASRAARRETAREAYSCALRMKSAAFRHAVAV